jgi:hypothetical protein
VDELRSRARCRPQTKFGESSALPIASVSSRLRFQDSQRIARWQDDPVWQPLRETVEKLITTYDWGECFVALNLVLKPMLDELFMQYMSDLALRESDHLLG